MLENRKLESGDGLESIILPDLMRLQAGDFVHLNLTADISESVKLSIRKAVGDTGPFKVLSVRYIGDEHYKSYVWIEAPDGRKTPVSYRYVTKQVPNIVQLETIVSQAP
jgi:hypothetical protein